MSGGPVFYKGKGGMQPAEGIEGNLGMATKLPYEYVEPGQSDAVLGGNGAAGDVIHRLICVVTGAAGAQVQIRDGVGGDLRVVFPANPGAGVGTYPLTLNMRSQSGGWRVTTGAGVAVFAVGSFSP